MGHLLDALLAAGVLSVVVQAIITNRRAAVERERELRGLLRLLLVEIEANDRTMQVMLRGESPGASEQGFEDEVWKDVRVRVAQLLRDEHDSHHLNLYYRNNANFGDLAFELAELGYDVSEPSTFPAATVKISRTAARDG